MATVDESSKPSLWNTRNYTLAALGGTLAVTAIVIIVSVCLRPAEISFSVSNASHEEHTSSGDEYLNLTIVASINATPRRAAVRYKGISVDLKNSSSSAGKNTIHATVETKVPDDFLPSPNVARFRASALLLGGLKSFAERSSGLTVVVTAEVKFKFWLGAKTWLYDIKVSCFDVLFPERSMSSRQTFECKA